MEKSYLYTTNKSISGLHFGKKDKPIKKESVESVRIRTREYKPYRALNPSFEDYTNEKCNFHIPHGNPIKIKIENADKLVFEDNLPATLRRTKIIVSDGSETYVQYIYPTRAPSSNLNMLTSLISDFLAKKNYPQ